MLLIFFLVRQSTELTIQWELRQARELRQLLELVMHVVEAFPEVGSQEYLERLALLLQMVVEPVLPCFPSSVFPCAVARALFISLSVFLLCLLLVTGGCPPVVSH